MRARRPLLLAVLSIAVSAGVAGASAASALTVPSSLHHKTVGAPVNGTVTAVSASNDVGDITVVAGAASSIRAVEQWNYAKPTFRWSLSHGVLTVTAHCPSGVRSTENNCAVDYVVTVPAAATVHAVADFGDVSTKAMRANEQLSSDFGDITASMAAAVTQLTARSSEGNVTFRVPAGTYDVSTSTDFGDVTVSGITRSAAATHHLSATSDFGDITISGV